MHFARRAPDALKGVYSGDGVTLTVLSSGDDQFTFSLVINDRAVATRAQATSANDITDAIFGIDNLNFFTATTDAGDCTYSMWLMRSEGKFYWSVRSHGTAACTVDATVKLPE
jgi:hypothetical protein